MKPTIEKFREAVEKYGGNLTKVAKSFNVSRTNIYNWLQDCPEFKEIVDDARGSLFDDCLSTAKVVALGIPDIQDGKMAGWITEPNPGMLKYLMSTLGKKEGFGESIDVTTNGNDVNSINLFRVLTKEEIENFDEHFDNEY